GQLLVVRISFNEVKLVDMKTGADRCHITADTKLGIHDAWLSPDGKRLALYLELDNLLQIFDTQTGGAIQTLKRHPEDLVQVGDFLLVELSFFVFSPDGQRVAVPVKQDTVRLWDVATGKVVHDLRDTGNDMTCVAFSPDGKRLATGS